MRDVMLGHGTEWTHTSLVRPWRMLSPGKREGASQRRVKSESGAPKLVATAHHARCDRAEADEGGWLKQTKAAGWLTADGPLDECENTVTKRQPQAPLPLVIPLLPPQSFGAQ